MAVYGLARHARLVAEWHPTKNGTRRPSDFSEHTSARAWWRCPKGFDHVWRAQINVRVQGALCPFCSGRRVSVTNSLAARRPEVAVQWHPTKNRPLRPTDVVAGSCRKVWWRCPRSPAHVWFGMISERTGPRAYGCPFCNHQRLAPDNSLARRRPELAALWHPAKNGGLTPADVMPASRRVVWWLCPQSDEHEWRSAVCDRRSWGCPFCANRRTAASSSLAARNRRLAKEWHRGKNGDLGPSDVVPGSNRVVWWRCGRDPTHEWKASVASRSRGSDCPYCSGRLFRRGGPGSLLGEAPEVARQWHPTKNGTLTPGDISIKSRRLVWFKCPGGPDHVWQSTAAHRGMRGQGCSFCTGRRASSTRSLATAKPDIAAEWHPTRNGSLTPHDVTPGSHRPVVWLCRKDPRHIWSTTPHARRGCPFCAGKRPLSEALPPDPKPPTAKPKARRAARAP